MQQFEITADDGTYGAVVGMDALEEALADFARRGIDAIALCERLFMGEASRYPEEGFWYIDPDGRPLETLNEDCHGLDD